MFGENRKSLQIEGLAKEALQYAHATPCSLTDALVKVAESNMLNPNEIESVCHKVNHLEWEEKRAKDKMSTFDAAKHLDASEKIKNISDTVMKVAMIEADMEFLIPTKIGTSNEKTAEEIGKEYLNLRAHEKGVLKTAAEENVDNLNGAYQEQEDTYTNIYNTIKELLQDGETLENVYEVLNKTWGETNKTVLDDDFPKIVGRLKDEGVIPQETQFNMPDEFEEREVEASELSKQAEKMMDINFDAVKYAYMNDKLMRMLKEAGGEYYIEPLQKRIKISSVQHLRNLGEKLAVGLRPGTVRSGVTHIYNRIQPIVQNAAPDAKAIAEAVMKETGKKVEPNMLQSIFRSALKNAIPPLLVGSAVYTATAIGQDAGRKKAKKELLRDYPELAQVEPAKFDKIFNDILTIDPSLTKTPYYLAQVLLHQKKWDTLETSTVGNLLSAKKIKEDSGPSSKAMRAADITSKLMPKIPA